MVSSDGSGRFGPDWPVSAFSMEKNVSDDWQTFGPGGPWGRDCYARKKRGSVVLRVIVPAIDPSSRRRRRRPVRNRRPRRRSRRRDTLSALDAPTETLSALDAPAALDAAAANAELCPRSTSPPLQSLSLCTRRPCCSLSKPAPSARTRRRRRKSTSPPPPTSLSSWRRRIQSDFRRAWTRWEVTNCTCMICLISVLHRPSEYSYLDSVFQQFICIHVWSSTKSIEYLVVASCILKTVIQFGTKVFSESFKIGICVEYI